MYGRINIEGNNRCCWEFAQVFFQKRKHTKGCMHLYAAKAFTRLSSSTNHLNTVLADISRHEGLLLHTRSLLDRRLGLRSDFKYPRKECPKHFLRIILVA